MYSNFNIPELVQEHTTTDQIAHVVAVHKDRYTIKCTSGVFSAEITGNMRFSAEQRSDLPAVGDWVEFMPFDEHSAVITRLIPRYSMLQRKAAGETSQAQLIAANIDYCFVVMSLNHDYNINRLERYISIIYDGNIEPKIILSKTDLQSNLQEMVDQIESRFPNIEVLCTSTAETSSIEALKAKLLPGKTYCFVGSSGVGKSTLLNHLLEHKTLATREISESNNKGKHTTTHRELYSLPNGAMIIDTPGMRELGMVDNSTGLAMTFSNINALAQECKFKNCSHLNEPGCAVLQALEDAELNQSEYENYRKLQKEQRFYAESLQERKNKGKHLSKLIKEVKANKKKYKY